MRRGRPRGGAAAGAAAGTLLSLLCLLTLLSPARAAAQTPAGPGYAEWASMEPAGREAFVRGFLIGAAWAEAGGAEGRDAATEAARLRRQGRLTFGFTPNVYLARLADHYFWENRRTQRLARAMLEVQRSLADGGVGPADGTTGRGAARGDGGDDDPGAAGAHPPAPGPPDPVLGMEGMLYLGWDATTRAAFAAGVADGSAAAIVLRRPGVRAEELDGLDGTGAAGACPPAACAPSLDAFYASRDRAGTPILEALSELAPSP